MPGFDVWSTLIDIRVAVRGLTKSPIFSIIAVSAVTLGVASGLAAFALVDAVTVTALPYPDPSRLVVLWGNVKRHSHIERRGASYPDFLDWRAQAESFEAVALYDSGMGRLSGDGEPEQVKVEMATSDYFSILGALAAIGRTFSSAEDAGRSPVMLLSDGFWTRRFGRDPGVIGRRLLFEGETFTVVGVLAPRVHGLTDATDVWIPAVMGTSPAAMASRSNRGWHVVGRLNAGVKIGRAQTELDTIARRLEQTYPRTNQGRGVEVVPLDVDRLGHVRPAVRALMAAVVVLVVIAWVNVANLVLARAFARRTELAIRMALGAGWRAWRRLACESAVLTVSGALLGIPVAAWLVSLLIAASPISVPQFVEPHLHAPALILTVAASLLCGIAAVILPTAHLRSVQLTEALRESFHLSSARRTRRTLTAFVVAQTALAVILLNAAALLIISVRNVLAVDVGFDAQNVLTLSASMPRRANPGTEQPDSDPLAARHQMVDRLRGIAGVSDVALATDTPLSGVSGAGFFAAEGGPPTSPDNAPRAYFHRVTPTFFNTLRIPVRYGRTFNADEHGTESPVVIVSERVATRFWPGLDPVGKRIKLGSLTAPTPWLSIVGVVGEVRYRGIPDNPTTDPDLYFPYVVDRNEVSILLRTATPPESVVPGVRAVIHATNPEASLYRISTLQQRLDERTRERRFVAWLLTVFGLAASSLSALGIYGVMAYSVDQRRRELGIRVAVGATVADVFRLVLSDGCRILGAGVALGILGSIVAVRFTQPLLYGTLGTNPVIGLGVLIIVIAGVIGCLAPALWASRVVPFTALKEE